MDGLKTNPPVTEKELSRKPIRILIAGFAVSVTILTLFSLISFIQITKERSTSDWIIHSFTVKLKMRESMSLLNNAQAEHRAFLLTYDSAFYHSFQNSIHEQKLINMQLDSLVNEYKIQVINMREFKRLSDRRRRQMVKVLDSAEILPLAELAPMLMAGAGIMDTLNTQVLKMEKDEDEHLQFRLWQKEKRERNISGWILGFSVIALVTIVSSFLILRTQRSRLSKAELNKIYLEAEVQKRTREILLVNRELNEKNIELKARNAELNNFTFISSHDMKEPLRKIETFLKLILETDGEKLSAESKEYANRIIVSAARMTMLINAILIYMKSAQKKKKEPVDLNKVVENVTKYLEKYIVEKSATISYHKLPIINAIPDQIESMFRAFLSNSLKFSKEDLRIQISCKPDTHSYTPVWRMEFSDNGIGFDMKYSEKIFKIFQRLHTKDEYPGTGLGLALVKRIVENHGGVISVNSEIGKGTTFTVIIPQTDQMVTDERITS